MPFPVCQLAMKWRGEKREIFPDVSRRVNLVGAKHPNDHFYIELPEQAYIAPLPAAQGQERTVTDVIQQSLPQQRHNIAYSKIQLPLFLDCFDMYFMCSSML